MIFKTLLTNYYSILIIQIMKALTIIVLFFNITDNSDLLLNFHKLLMKLSQLLALVCL